MSTDRQFARPSLVSCRFAEAELERLFFPRASAEAEDVFRGDWVSVDLSTLSVEHMLESNVLYLGDGTQEEDTFYFTLSLRRSAEDSANLLFIVEGVSDRDLTEYTTVRMSIQSTTYDSSIAFMSDHEVRAECSVPLDVVLDRRHQRVAKPIVLQIF